MAKLTNPLDHVRVASPCRADWAQMLGDDRVRFCGQCSLNVYNLSGMSKQEAEALFSKTEGRLCVRYYKRADGTILTQNCPVGLRALKRRINRMANAALSAVLGFCAGLGIYRMAPEEMSIEALPLTTEMGQRAVLERPVQPQPFDEAFMGEAVVGTTEYGADQFHNVKPLRRARK